MAEGGGDEKDDNPFSFKKFVGASDRNDQNRAEEDTETENCSDPDLIDVSTSRRERRDPDGRKNSKDDRDGNHAAPSQPNPFSFKKFLQSGSRGVSSNGPSSLATLDLAHDLPDFVQDYYTGSDPSHRHRAHPVPGEVPLPDFALDSESSSLPHLSPSAVSAESNSHSSFPYRDREDGLNLPDLNDVRSDNGGARPRTNAYPGQPVSQPVPRLDLDHLNKSDSESDEEVHPRLCQTNSSGGLLPDFLPDSVLSSVGARPKISQSVLENGVHSGDEQGDDESLSSQIRQLTLENESLRQQLETARLQAENETRRVSSVLKEKDDFQKKDAEDTAVLERVIAQVEANLETATQRAAEAERTVAKQKQEIQHLQMECDNLRRENEGLRGGQGAAGQFESATQKASEQIMTAANLAEQQLRQLLTGVDQLKMVAEFLSSADKLRDVNGETSSTQGADGGVPL